MRPFNENTTLLTQLEELATSDSERPAYIFVDKDLGERVITRREIWNLTRKCGAIFKRMGLSKGGVVCNTLVNSPEKLISLFGTMATGAIPTQGQLFLADGSDLLRVMKESGSTAILYDPNLQNGAKGILDKIKYVDKATGKTRYKDLPNLELVVEIAAKEMEEGERWFDVVNKEEDMFVEENISKDDIAMIFATSGTTGFSKLVPHSHSNLVTMFRDSVSKDCRMFASSNLGWLGGFPARYPSYGDTRILFDITNGAPKTTGEFYLSVFNRYYPESVSLMSTGIKAVLDAISAGGKLERKFSILYTGGGPVNSAVMDSLGIITNKVCVAYGGTEFLLVSRKEVTTKSDFQDMCAGKPIDSCEVRIVGDDEKDVLIGEQGEIFVRSALVSKGYLNDPTRTKAAFTEDGFYRTGDIGYFDKEGQLFVLCRKADVIIKNGYLDYPGWMEKLINKHPALENAIVIGIPDTVHHEEICLCYKQVPGSDVTNDELSEHCKKLFLTGEKESITPVPIYYLKVDEIITNSNGKVDRKKMRDEAMRRLKNNQ